MYFSKMFKLENKHHTQFKQKPKIEHPSIILLWSEDDDGLDVTRVELKPEPN